MAKKHQIYARSSKTLTAVNKKGRRQERQYLKQYEGMTVKRVRKGR